MSNLSGTELIEKRQQFPNLQILDAATQYKSAWDILKNQLPGSGVVFPLVNVGAVGVELYLKCMIAEVVYTPDPWDAELSLVMAKPQIIGHNLGKIFENLSSKVRRKINQNFKIEYPASHSSFREFLRKVEGAFVRSRYPFDSAKGISMYRLQEIEIVLEFLQNFVSNLEVEEWITVTTK